MFEKLSKFLKIFKFQANATLKDGTEIIIDGNLDVDVKVYVVTSDGEIPLPDGEYELGDPYSGYIITVENGIITNVLEPVEEEEPAEETEAETEAETEDDPSVSFEEQIASIQEQIKEIIERLNNLESNDSDLSKESEELKKSNEELKKQNTEFSAQISEFEKVLENTKGAEPLKKKTETESSLFNFNNPRLQVIRGKK